MRREQGKRSTRRTDVKASSKKKNAAGASAISLLDEVKRLTIIAIFSDDSFMEQFVLKGGTALEVVHRVSTRASLDVDLSMERDFPEDSLETIRMRIERALQSTFRQSGLEAFDVKIAARPDNISADLSEFWGGYKIEFKLISSEKYIQLAGNTEQLQRNAIMLGERGKFSIDLSKYEHTASKQLKDLDGYRIYVYSPAMVVCEKLRAICQQMPEYGPVVRRDRPGTPRARDYVDIHSVIEHFGLEMDTDDNLQLLTRIFSVKKVPIGLLAKICQYRDFHETDFRSVVDTVKANVYLQSFKFYADYVEELAAKLFAKLQTDYADVSSLS